MWEYLTTTHAADLVQLGQQGWELIGVVTSRSNDGVTFYCKRPVPS